MVEKLRISNQSYRRILSQALSQVNDLPTLQAIQNYIIDPSLSPDKSKIDTALFDQFAEMIDKATHRSAKARAAASRRKANLTTEDTPTEPQLNIKAHRQHAPVPDYLAKRHQHKQPKTKKLRISGVKSQRVLSRTIPRRKTM